MTTENLRNPTGSEITVQAYMALAHGAKGVDYYCYKSQPPVGGSYWQAGLVDINFAHSDPVFAEKWQAVQDVFTQLDSLGDDLLTLDRVAAYCAKDGGFISPITDVHFEDDNEDYIEVGQFEYNNDDYLILVNRRTNADRHITVQTNLSGTRAMRDLYTQEQFISSTGDFQWIPFDSGQGRVFKLESFSDWNWTNHDRIVLADSVAKSGTPSVLTVAAGTTVKATKLGMLYFPQGQTIDCNGEEGDSVRFTALEPDLYWKWLKFNNSGNTSCADTLDYTVVEYAFHYDCYAAIRLYNNSRIIMNRCLVSHNGDAFLLDGSRFELKNSTVSDNLGNGLVEINSDGSVIGCSFSDCNSELFMILPLGGNWEIGHNHIIGNNAYAIWGQSGTLIMLRSSAYPGCGQNYILNNTYTGVYGSLYTVVHLGRDQDRPGWNCIYGNGLSAAEYDVWNGDESTTLHAQYNYWGGAPNDSQFCGLVDSSNWLMRPPEEEGWLAYFPKVKTPHGAPDGPGVGSLSEANRLNDVAVNLFLDGENYSAVDTFALVIEEFPGTLPARFALNQTVACYRAERDYAGAVAYLTEFLQSPPDTSLVNVALYHKLMNLARTQDYTSALAIGGNLAVVQSWGAGLAEPGMIEVGMIYKYGVGNVTMGNSVFAQFLSLYPESDLAFIAAMELGQGGDGRDLSGGSTTVLSVPEIPVEYSLAQNFPNPFNPTTLLSYELRAPSRVRLEVFDIAGRLVTILVDSWQAAGNHRVTFDGAGLPSGLYFARLSDFASSGSGTTPTTAVQKLVLLK